MKAPRCRYLAHLRGANRTRPLNWAQAPFRHGLSQHMEQKIARGNIHAQGAVLVIVKSSLARQTETCRLGTGTRECRPHPSQR